VSLLDHPCSVKSKALALGIAPLNEAQRRCTIVEVHGVWLALAIVPWPKLAAPIARA